MTAALHHTGQYPRPGHRRTPDAGIASIGRRHHARRQRLGAQLPAPRSAHGRTHEDPDAGDALADSSTRTPSTGCFSTGDATLPRARARVAIEDSCPLSMRACHYAWAEVSLVTTAIWVWREEGAMAIEEAQLEDVGSGLAPVSPG